jgi:hypothetical protein
MVVFESEVDGDDVVNADIIVAAMVSGSLCLNLVVIELGLLEVVEVERRSDDIVDVTDEDNVALDIVDVLVDETLTVLVVVVLEEVVVVIPKFGSIIPVLQTASTLYTASAQIHDNEYRNPTPFHTHPYTRLKSATNCGLCTLSFKLVSKLMMLHSGGRYTRACGQAVQMLESESGEHRRGLVGSEKMGGSGTVRKGKMDGMEMVADVVLSDDVSLGR